MATIVALTGMNGCGKTALIQNLAASSALHGLTTGCFTCDMSYPDIQLRFQGTIIDESNCIDALFTAADPSSRFVPAKGIPNLYITGVPANTTAIQYEPPDSIAQQERFIENLRNGSAFNIIFIEAGDPVKNSFAYTVIDCADILLNVIDVTEVGINYFEAYVSYLKDIREERGMYHILRKEWHNIGNAKTREYQKHALAVIPHCKHAAYGHQAGLPLALKKNLTGRDAAYMRSVNSICRLVSTQKVGDRQ